MPRRNAREQEREHGQDGGAPPDGDRHLRRAGLDYWQYLKWRVVDHLDEVAAELGHDRLWLFSTKADRVYTDVTYQAGDALIFGPESRGLPVSWLTARPDRTVRIPIRPEARSLNLSNAVAVAAFEAMRQIGPSSPDDEPNDY